MKKYLLILLWLVMLLPFFGTRLSAQSYTEGFETAIPLPTGWVQENLSPAQDLINGTNWFQGNDAVFPAQSGTSTSYIGANFNNTTGDNTISNWLFTPNRTYNNGDMFSFWTRTVDVPNFADRLEVRLSTAGASTNAGGASLSVGDFTTLLLTVNPTLTLAGYPAAWTQFSVTLSGLGGPTSGRIAFRYFVTDGGPAGDNSDFIGIDNVVYTAVSPCADPAPTATVTSQPSCLVATGTVTVTTPAPAAGVSYTVTGTAPVVAAVSGTSGVFSGLTQGVYSVTSTIAGCTSAPTSLTVNAPPPPTACICVPPTATEVTICAGGSGSLTSSTVCVGAPTPVISIPGTTNLTDPTYNRSLAGITYSASGIGTAVHYNTIPFTVNINGTYDILMTSVHDAFLTLHQISFNPATPGINFVEADDDDGPGSNSLIMTVTLTVGTTYILVPSGFDNNSVGPYTITYTGPGQFITAPTLQWYNDGFGGAPIGTGSSFNPVGVPGSTLANTNVPGIDSFFVACSSDPTCRRAVAFKIENTPTTPTVGTITQPTCSVPTGSVVLNGLPSAGAWTLTRNPGAVVTLGIGGTATVSSLASGTYTFTVTNIFGCPSVASANVVINAAPTPPAATGVTVCFGGTGLLTSPGCLGAIPLITIPGTTTLTDPTYNRSLAGITYSASSVGTAVHYNTIPFTVSVTGTYDILMTSVHDAFLTLHQTSFNPATPAINFVEADDDDGPGSNSLIMTVTLTVGTTYILVPSGFNNNSVGPYTITYTGTGQFLSSGTSSGTLQWYTTGTGGAPIGTGSPFNPAGVAGSGLPNTNVSGTYTFYAACSGDPTCRTAVDFVVLPAPPPFTITKTAGPVHYDQCANPDEVITEITIRIENTTGQVVSNVSLDELITTVPGAFLGLVEYPAGIQTNALVSPQLNYAWNGTTNTSLLANTSGVLGLGNFVQVTLKLRFNASLLAGPCIPNTTIVAGTYTGPTSDCPVTTVNATCVGGCDFPTLTTLPANLTVNACESYDNEIQHWLATYGGATFDHACREVEIICNDYCAPHAWQYLDNCSKNAILPVRFTVKYTDGSTFEFCSVINKIDPQVVSFVQLPQNLVIDCNSPNASAQIQAWLADNGGSIGRLCEGYLFNTNNYSGGVPPTCGAGQSVTFTITNECGLSTSAVATITVIDNVAPTFTFVPASITVACSAATPALGTATATDACSGATVTFSDVTTGTVCTGITTTRTFTATDACGNTATAVQSVTKSADTAAPTFTSVPSNTSYDCGGTALLGTATATDACSSVTVTFMNSQGAGSCAGPSTIRTFTATDGCGNTATAVQVSTPFDIVAPAFGALTEVIEIMCGDAVVFETPTVTDNCTVVTITHVDDVNGDQCAGIMNIRYFTATDACGNTATAKQTVWQLGDHVDPEFTNQLEDEAVYFCGETPDYDGVGAVDNCGGSVTVSYEIDYDYEDYCYDGYGYYSKVRYTAVDACGNENHETITSHFVPEDHRMAFMYKPVSKTVTCSEAYTFDAVYPKVVSYDGAISSVTYTDIANLTPCGSGTIIRRWTATDVVGNSAIAEQTVTILPDTELPTFVLANNSVVVSCATAITVQAPLVSDNCSTSDAITLTYTDVNVENTVQRTWSAADACGNVANATQIYIILDTQAPVFTTALQNKTINCGAPVIFDNAVAADACSAVTMSYADTQLAINCGTEHTRTWTASDAVGNASTIVQKITVVDNAAPIFSYVPANQVVASANLVIFGTPLATDNCQNVLLTYSDVQTEPICGNTGYTVTRTWVANDGCNNQALASQQISVALDDQAPVFSSTPVNQSVALGAPIVFTALTATDNNGAAILTYADVQGAPACGNSGYTITRTWTSTDACNNMAIAMQQISVGFDVAAPVFVTQLLDKTINCGGSVEFDSPVATDNSGNFEVSYSDAQTTPSCGNSGYDLIRTHTATDACNNAAEMIQTIHITADIEAPVFTSAYVNLEMTNAVFTTWQPSPLSAVDNCQSVEVTIGTPVKIDDCNYKLDYTATDACGNFMILTQHIHIADCLVLGTDEGVLAGVRVYPNPVETELNIELPSTVNLKDVTAQIIDIVGREVSMTQVVQLQSIIDVSSLVSGAYTLRLITGKVVKTVRFVKIQSY